MLNNSTAKFLRINAECLISRRKLTDWPSLKARVEDCREGLRIEMETFVAAMPTKLIEINKRWPKDWWQAFRERWFPVWWITRWPIQYKGIHIKQQLYSRVCPHLRKDSESMHLKFLTYDSSPERISG